MSAQSEKLLRAIGELDEELILDAAPLEALPQKRGRRGVRGFIAAAVAVVLLVGTAFAVSEIAGLRIDWEDHGISVDGYSVEYTVDFYPLDRFTAEAKAMADNPDAHQYFHTWDEMEAFFGLDLADNPALDNAQPSLLDKTEPWDRDHTEQGVTHILFVPVFTDDGTLYTVQCLGDYKIDGIVISILEIICTEAAEGNLHYPGASDGYHVRQGIVHGEGHESVEETYTTPNGLTATIVKTVQTGPEESVSCDAHFLIHGAAFRVGAGASGPDDGRVMEVLKTVLDGFVF